MARRRRTELVSVADARRARREAEHRDLVERMRRLGLLRPGDPHNPCQHDQRRPR
jgi:hypothetical protein